MQCHTSKGTCCCQEGLNIRIPVRWQWRQMIAEKQRCDRDDRLMSQFSPNVLVLHGPHFPSYWLSLAHVRPCWLCVTSTTLVGFRALGSGVRHLQLMKSFSSGDWAVWTGWKTKHLHLMASPSNLQLLPFFHIQPFFILICYFLNNGQSCLDCFSAVFDNIRTLQQN